MKSKLRLALASLFIGLAAFSVNSAHAFPGEWWGDSEADCALNAPEHEGKAAYGEPLEEKADPAMVRDQLCSDGEVNIYAPHC